MQQSPSPAQGFTLLEVLITLAIAVIGVLAITELTQLYLQIVADEKFRVTASAIANEKIETIRNLSYSDVGTKGGIPPGNLIQTEELIKNSKTFKVTTEVVYIDDPFDGLITTTGMDNSIYNASSSEVIYYWAMETNTEGQSPDKGSGTLSFTGTSVTTGNQNNGIQMENGDKITTTSAGNIDLTKGRIGLWYKPDTDDATDGGEYFVKLEASGDDFEFYRRTNEKVRLKFGGHSVTSATLSWNPGQWYFMEAAWEGDSYREIWRDGVPLALKENSGTIPTLQTDMYIGYKGNNQGEIRGVIDELYILNESHKFEIWGYNQSNPYFQSNPQVTFYWDMNTTSTIQTPQVGTGTIQVGGNVVLVDPAVKDAGIELQGNGHTDYSFFSPTDNIDFSEGRIAFWYRPRNANVYSYNTPNLIYANCTDGHLHITRDSDQQLNFQYGTGAQNVLLESQSYSWNNKWWYLIEAAWEDSTDSAHLYINRQEVASNSTSTVSAPTGCNTMYLGNQSVSSTMNGEGDFDEVYILDDAFPESETQDTLNTDYKRVKVTVEWEDSLKTHKLFMMTDIAPPGIETTDGGGTLMFKVFDASGQPVSNADVSVYNPNLNPKIQLQLSTNNKGELLLPGAPATSTSYEIIVDKFGYSTDYTMAATSSYINPVRDHLSVLEGETTQVSFAIDEVSSLTVQSVSQSLPVNWQINTDTDDVNQYNAAIAHTSSTLYFAWEDPRTASTSLIYSQKYNTGGTSQWANDSNSTASSSHQYMPQLALDSSENQYITWYDDASGDNDVYIAKQNSSGNDAWGAYYKVNNSAGGTNQLNPSIAFVNNEAIVVWQDTKNDSGDIYFNKFSTAGTRLLGSDVKINTDSGSAVQTNPKIAVGSDNSLYIAWLDNRNGQYDVYLHKVDTAGAGIWSNEMQVNVTNGSNITSFDTTITSDDTTYITWNDNLSGNYDIYWQGVASTSLRAFVSDQQIATQSPNSSQLGALIAADTNDDLFVAWHDNRGSNNDVYVMLQDTNGTLQWPQEVQLNLTSDGEQTLTALSVYDATKVIGVWNDSNPLLTDTNVWAGTLNYDGSETAVPFVDFNLTGSKLTHTSPDLHKYSSTTTTDGTGSLTLSDLEWDTYTLTMTDSAFTLIQIDPPSPFVLNPATSTAIKMIVN